MIVLALQLKHTMKLEAGQTVPANHVLKYLTPTEGSYLCTMCGSEGVWKSGAIVKSFADGRKNGKKKKKKKENEGKAEEKEAELDENSVHMISYKTMWSHIAGQKGEGQNRLRGNFDPITLEIDRDQYYIQDHWVCHDGHVQANFAAGKIRDGPKKPDGVSYVGRRQYWLKDQGCSGYHGAIGNSFTCVSVPWQT